MSLHDKILTAALNNGFTVHYQPRFTTADRFPVMVEALLRCESAFPIDQVVHRMEQNGVISDVTLFVVDTVCSDMNRLLATNGWTPKMAINISQVLFARQHFFDSVMQIVNRHGIAPSMIEFEITESSSIHDIDHVSRTTMMLKNHGFLIGLDDFGSGFTNLKYLDKIAVSSLKIDRYFINGIGSSNKCKTIAEAIAKIAESSGITSVAEGVETDEQMDAVSSMGYQEVQGFLLARPMPFQSLERFLASFNHLQSNVAPLHSHFL